MAAAAILGLAAAAAAQGALLRETCTGAEAGECQSTAGTLWLQFNGALGKQSLNLSSEDVQFIPVDGGSDRACRGSRADDNSNAYFLQQSASSIDDCKSFCMANALCKGIEFSAGRCEVWVREEGIGASARVPGYTCLRYLSNTNSLSDFEAVDGGDGRACRGSGPADNKASYYSVLSASSLDQCRALCTQTVGCKGLEYGPNGRCEVWTRPEGVMSSVAVSGYTCMRFIASATATTTNVAQTAFEPVDGGDGRACRGSGPNDSRSSYYTISSAGSLDQCSALCAQTSGCVGLEYGPAGRCEVWTKPGGIQASKALSGFTCLRYVPTQATTTLATSTSPASTATTTDESSEWLTFPGLNCFPGAGAEAITGKDPLARDVTETACKAECLKEPGCDGVAMPAEGAPARMCWLRMNVELSRCHQGTPFNFWVRPGAPPPATDMSPTTTIDPSQCCSAFDLWPNLDNGVTCSSCMALVLTSPYRGRCDRYCESFGHVCVAAAEEQSEDCVVKYTKGCDEEIAGTSDMLCTCRLPSAVDVDSCQALPTPAPSPLPSPVPAPVPAPQPVPSPVTTTTATPLQCCSAFSSWPDVDNGVTCDACTALVLTSAHGGRCDRYCESFGHVCVAAAEEQSEDCMVKYTKGCDEEIAGTSDMLCTCRLPSAVDVDSCQALPTPAPSPLPTPVPAPQPVPSPVTTTTATPLQCCSTFSAWPDVDNGVTCDACTALVLTSLYGGRCDRYCESFGHVCVAAAEEQNENCEVKYSSACDQQIGTSDMLCTCQSPNAPSSCSALAPVPTPLPTPSPTPLPTPSPPTGQRRIEVVGRQLRVDGRPLHLKGVAWNPVPRGGVHPRDLDFAGFVEQDAELMQRMGINAVRTYEPITDPAVLDVLWSRGIWVLNSVYNWGGASADSAAAPVNAVKDHPAILMWTIGNEWNYNGLYVGMSFFDCIARINEVAGVVLQHDTSHPVASIYGELGRLNEAIESLNKIDLWGINTYRGISFGSLFEDYAAMSGKPMFLGEYGADAFNSLIRGEDEASQADATRELTEEIVATSSVRDKGVCLGGFVFEFSDEWHKDGDGSPSVHDTGGIAPGGGPYPDMTFNEEWWGLVKIDRSPRLAFNAYANVALPAEAQASISVTA